MRRSPTHKAWNDRGAQGSVSTATQAAGTRTTEQISPAPQSTGRR